ncbi:cysteine dioxygenase [Roseateles sp.]|uniref:cysteine dioxygenase family protein n=1 Tax=Roseateles sp. TaxID=1971397 RepID=UPI0039EA9DCC
MPDINTTPLRDFIVATTAVLREQPDEAQALDRVGTLLSALVAHDGWLPDDLAAPDPARYRQYLLHADPQGLFSVVSFVWGPGQSTPVHDHTVWGLIGMLRGEEVSQPYGLDAQGHAVPQGQPSKLTQGAVEAVSPRIGDIHRVANAFDDRVSISIHVYGANIGTVHRHVYAQDGTVKPFVSGYSNTSLPNLWGAAA